MLDPTVQAVVHTAMTVDANITQVVFSGLQPFTSYQVRIVARNRRGLEGCSDWTRVTTHSAPPSEVARINSVKISDGKSLLLSWDEPAVPNGKVCE